MSVFANDLPSFMWWLLHATQTVPQVTASIMVVTIHGTMPLKERDDK